MNVFFLGVVAGFKNRTWDFQVLYVTKPDTHKFFRSLLAV